MENHRSTDTPSSAAVRAPSSNIYIPVILKPHISPQNSHLPPICEPYGFYSSGSQFSGSYPIHHQTGCQSYGLFRPIHGSHGNESVSSVPNAVFRDDERRFLDAWTTKVARSKRKMARQRSLSSSRGSSLSAFGCSEDSKGLIISSSDAQNNCNRSRYIYTFNTPDKKILRFLLKKELKNSDVGSLGRIVLPKREAEENLPVLSDKEGVQVVIRDVHTDRQWAMKYKYWANNRSRMYVLENTGDFVRQNGLVIGDSMTLYEDECKNLYVAVKKAEKSVGVDATETKNEENSSSATFTSMAVKDEEEASLALLIEELKHKAEDQEIRSCNLAASGNSDSCYGFERGCCISRRSPTVGYERTAAACSYTRGKGKEFEDHHQTVTGFEDCFGGLDTLPEVSGYKHPLFEYLSNDG